MLSRPLRVSAPKTVGRSVTPRPCLEGSVSLKGFSVVWPQLLDRAVTTAAALALAVQVTAELPSPRRVTALHP